MNKKRLKKCIVVLLTITILLSMTACQKKIDEKRQTTERGIKDMVFEATDLEIEGIEGDINNILMNNGRLYIKTLKMTNESDDNLVYLEEASEGYEDIAHEKKERDYSEKLYSIDIKDGDLIEIPLPDFGENEELLSMEVGKDGNILYLINFCDKKTARDDYLLLKVDRQGNELFREDITKLLKLKEEDYISKILIDDKGRIIVAVNSSVYILDENVKHAEEVKIEEQTYFAGMAMTQDGQIVCALTICSAESTDTQLRVLDVEEIKWGDSYEVDLPYFMNLMNGVYYDVYYSDDSGIYGYDFASKKSTKIMDYMASNITSENSFKIIPIANDTFIGTVFDENNAMKMVLYKKVASSIIKEKRIITLGGIWIDDTIKKQAIEYNKNNKEYQIEIKDYSKEEDPIAKINVDIVAGKVPDILLLNELPYEQYIAKGMLEDLTPYFEGDEEVHTEDIIDSVLEAMKTDSCKLYYITPSFSVSSIVGRTSDVGDGTGWTFNDLKVLLEEKGDRARPFYSENKSDMLHSFLMNGLDDFVNWKTGECNFDSQEFKDILEICAEGNDEETDYSDDSPSMVSLIREGKVLLVAGGVSPDQVQLYKKIFDDEVTYIGYPDEEKQGSYFQFDNQLAIYSKSEVKEEAWEFIRSFMKKDFQGKTDNLYNSPTRKDCFDMMLKAMSTTEEYVDELGQEIHPMESLWGYENLEVEIKPLSQEEVQLYTNIVNNTRKVGTSDDTMLEIVLEETEAYFAGEKSLDETIDIIQNRITIYVNENR